ncbi:hypothetical protein ABT275_37140 [Streptomyces sp. NPDC001185]|uniref:DUF7224 domain-containing protein n=1 Tax=Streptomyces sp. NPDC001185 TaxID=3154380 RepID=UPI0033242AAA
MKFSTSWWSGCARWAFPALLLLTFYFYTAGESQSPSEFHGYAPSIVSSPLMSLYAISYAVAAALAAWESGRISSAGVWSLAPARSRFRIAANVLLPVLLITWGMLLVPAAVSLIRASTFPNAGSLRLPVMAVCLCVAHATIGFAIGLKVPRVVAVPLVAVVDFVVVSFTRSVDPYWLRHVSGQYTDLSFGDVPKFSSVVAPILFVGGLAVGLVILWIPIGSRLMRVVPALVITAAGAFGGYQITSSWGHDPALIEGQAPSICSGHNPRVCMPTASSTLLPETRKEAATALAALRVSGLSVHPLVIRDRLGEGREYRRSTNSTWYVSLTSAAESHTVRYQVAMNAVKFPCTNVEIHQGHAAMLWVASVAGEGKQYSKRLSEDAFSPDEKDANKQVEDVVSHVLTLPAKEQLTWYKNTLKAACSGSGK